MKIISKFHDYYDKGMGHGHDTSLMFLRETSTHVEKINHPGARKQEPPALFKFIWDGRFKIPQSLDYNNPSQDGKFKSISVGFSLIYVAGRMYPMAVITQRQDSVRIWRSYDGVLETINKDISNGLNPGVHSFAYTQEVLDEYLTEHNVDLKPKRKYRFWNGDRVPVKEFFALRGKEEPRCTEAKVAIVAVDSRYMVINPRLSDYQFYRALDPFEIFQELSMFLSNIAAPDNVPVTISDKDRIQQYGFDKWSFRKPPQE